MSRDAYKGNRTEHLTYLRKQAAEAGVSTESGPAKVTTMPAKPAEKPQQDPPPAAPTEQPAAAQAQPTEQPKAEPAQPFRSTAKKQQPAW